jgi:hypothetical protein
MEINPNLSHQADAARRDRALDKKIQADKIQILRCPQAPKTVPIPLPLLPLVQLSQAKRRKSRQIQAKDRARRGCKARV